MNYIQEKANRLVDEDRVHVLWANDAAGHGIVDGDTDIYHCSFSPAGRICTCRAGRTHRDCSHALALEWKVWKSNNLQLVLV
jgi:hypothetical protein